MNKRISIESIAAALFCAGLSLAETAVAAGDCWLDVYDKPEMQGAHVRIEGPAELPNLRNLNNENWGSRIESLAVGPKAGVLAFRREDYKEDKVGLTYHSEAIQRWGDRPESFSDQEISFGPGHTEHHLGELNFHRNINSLKIMCLR